MSKELTVFIQPPLPKDWTWAPHRHIQFELALVREGACTITCPTEMYLKKGSVFFIPSGVSHGFTCASPLGVQFVVIYFMHVRADVVQALLNADPLGVFRLSEIEQARFLEISYRLQREINGALPYATLLTEAMQQELFVLLLRANDQSKRNLLRKEQEELLESAIDWMHKNCCDESITVDEVARRAGLSSSYFRKMFNQLVGSSPKRYLTMLRLQTSKSLLMHSGRTITDIALLSGFSSPQQFSKVFRQHNGLSPSEWQRIHLV